MECAVELFIEKGYFNTSIRDIIMLSGFGTGTFYNYFIDKEDVLKALLEEFAEQIVTSIRDYYIIEKDLYERFIETKRVTMEVFAQNEKLSERLMPPKNSGPVNDLALMAECFLIPFLKR